MKVFVYDEWNSKSYMYKYLSNPKHLGTKKIRGVLYSITENMLHYPVMREGDGKVQGELLDIDVSDFKRVNDFQKGKYFKLKFFQDNGENIYYWVGDESWNQYLDFTLKNKPEVLEIIESWQSK